MVANLYNQEDFNVFKELKKKKRKESHEEAGREEGRKGKKEKTKNSLAYTVISKKKGKN